MAKPSGSHPSPKKIGVASEALVLARLIELGYHVSVPFGDHLRYDFIADDGKELLRIQVKTGRLRHGSVVFSARSTNWYSHEQRSYIGEADDFLVYCPDTNEIYRVPVAECGLAAQVYLRVEDSSRVKGRTNLRWARNHVFTESLSVARSGSLGTCSSRHPDTPPRLAETKASGGGTRRYCKECERVYHQQRRARMRAESEGVA